MENGSGGFMGDLWFVGGAVGLMCGSQQFTSRNLKFKHCKEGMYILAWLARPAPHSVRDRRLVLTVRIKLYR